MEAIGEGVTSVVPADHVVLAAAYCGHCTRCRRGEMAYCENPMAADFGDRRLDGTTAISSHLFGQSAFATHATSWRSQLASPLEHLGPLGCGFNTGAGTVSRRPFARTALEMMDWH